MSSVLDLPLEKQEELAKLQGMTHEDWVGHVKARSRKTKQALNEDLSTPSNLRLTEGERHLYQARIDSENPR